MSYLPLARKYRPMTFSDLVGQESVTKAISNAIRLGREPHAVIFSGVRGIGKTTTARLYAKALNCEDTSTQEPCNECVSCHAITKGNHEDVIEIDGASNNGVDEIRSIRESVSYIPQRSKYKVYIIDEVHMLSTNAFNALLKTLEEPPPHVIFVFATTELQKVPQTVVGRCQTFYLQKIRLTTMTARVAEILKLENIEYEEKAISLVAREGHGSMRDALSFLDQSIALGGGKVTLEGVSQLTSNLSAAPYIELLGALITRNPEGVLALVEKLDEEGQVFREVCEETAKVARHGFVLKDLGKAHLDIALLGLDDQDITALSEIAENAGMLDLNRIFRTLVKCISDMDGSALDRFIFENYLIEWCVDPGLPSIETLMNQDVGGGAQQGFSQPQNTQRAPVQNFQQPQAQQAQPVAQAAKPKRSLTASFAQAKAADQKKNITPSSLSPATSAPVVEQAPVQQAPVQQAPVQQAPVQQAPVQQAPVQQAPVQQAPVQQAPVQHAVGGTFPPTWRALVNAWKAKKPLQARKLEEVHPIEYTPEKIVVAVDPNGMVGPALLKRDTQVKIAAAFGELFGFAGDFSAIPRDGATKILEESAAESEPGSINSPVQDQQVVPSAQTGSPLRAPNMADAPKPETAPEFKSEPIVNGAQTAGSQDLEQLPDSILQQKSRELDERRAEVISAAENAPLTQHMQAALDAEVGKVEITSQALL
ncbi:DNA polymerase III subunit gamma/tau [bacterium]|nr:DNA polymerase III subunit gamma/tau [bacterium]